jgi:type IV secretion system protein TrbL
MKKKIFIAVLLLAFFSTPAFSFSVASLARGEYKLMDIPLIEGIDYFQKTMWSFYYYARLFAVFLGVVSVCWTSFRLWAGTYEVRRAVVDIFCKFLIFTALFNAYPVITNYVIDYAIHIGMTAGNGFNTVNANFNVFAQSMERRVELGQRQLAQMLRTGARMSSDVAKQLASISYVSREEQESFLAAVQVVNVRDPRAMDPGFIYYEHPVSGDPVSTSLSDFFYRMDQQRKDNAAESVSSEEFSDAVVALQAMQEIFTRDPLDPSRGPTIGASLVRDYTLSPYLLDAEGSQTNLLSPAALIKLSVVSSQVTAHRMDNWYDRETATIRQRGFFGRAQGETIGLLLSDIQHFILCLFMTLATILTMVFFVIQYVMCIFEYFVVTSAGAIFIPFCLFDGTKSFTAKLVTLFAAYFIKLMVMTLCLFWAIGTFINADVVIMTDPNPASMLNIAYFAFTTLLCWVVTQNGPAIAVSLLNGNPQLSMGEFLHAAGTAAAGAMLARRAAQAGIGGLQHAAKTGQGAVRAGQTVAARWQGAGAAAGDAGLAGFARFGAQLSGFGRLTTDSMVQRMGEAFTGAQSRLDGESGRPNIGRVGAGHSDKFLNKNGSQGYGDALSASREAANAHLQKKYGNKDDAGKPDDGKPDDDLASTSHDEKRS